MKIPSRRRGDRGRKEPGNAVSGARLIGRDNICEQSEAVPPRKPKEHMKWTVDECKRVEMVQKQLFLECCGLSLLTLMGKLDFLSVLQ